MGARRRGVFLDESLSVAPARIRRRADVLDIFRRELDAAYAEGGVFQLTLHPHIIGYRSRIWIVEEIIRHARSLGNVWFATHAQVVQWAKLEAEAE